jgi:hypothetical protein
VWYSLNASANQKFPKIWRFYNLFFLHIFKWFFLKYYLHSVNFIYLWIWSELTEIFQFEIVHFFLTPNTKYFIFFVRLKRDRQKLNVSTLNTFGEIGICFHTFVFNTSAEEVWKTSHVLTWPTLLNWRFAHVSGTRLKIVVGHYVKKGKFQFLSRFNLTKKNEMVSVFSLWATKFSFTIFFVFGVH